MIKIEDFIPHRQLINHALRKASNDLKVQISVYQTRYEQKMAECKKEIEGELARKNQHFEKIKQAYIEQIKSECAALESTQAIFFKYVDGYRELQILRFRKGKVGQEIALRKEHCDFLKEQMRMIDEDIAILAERKDILAKQCDVEDIKALIQLSQSDIECLSSDDAKSLLDKVTSIIRGSEETNETTRSLFRLRTILHGRAEYLPVIQYVSWLIKQKEELKRELKNSINSLQAERKDLFALKDELDNQINSKNQVLEEYAIEVRNIWAKPLADILIEEARVITERSQYRNLIAEITAEGSSDDRWDDTWNSINRITKQILPQLTSARNQWKCYRKNIFEFLKKNNIYLLTSKDCPNDEKRVLNKRKNELLALIEQLTMACEQEKDKKKAELSVKLADIEQRIKLLQTQETQIKQRLTNANKDIDLAEKRDSRGFFARIWSDSYDVMKAKEKKTAISRELGHVQRNIVEAQSDKKQYQEKVDKALAEIDIEYKRKISVAKNEITAIDRAIAYQEKQKKQQKEGDRK